MSAQDRPPAPRGNSDTGAAGVGHRDSDASDVSTSHLMVYEDERARKSSISFDKIRQISLTYSLQSEDDDEAAAGGGGTPTTTTGSQVPMDSETIAEVEMGQQQQEAQLSNGCSGNQAESPSGQTKLAPGLEVHVETELVRAQQPIRECPISGPQSMANGSQFRPEVVSPRERRSRNPFVHDAPPPPPSAPDNLLFSPATWASSLWPATSEKSQQRGRARSPATCWPEAMTDSVSASAEPIHRTTQNNISLKLPRNMSASIVINNQDDDDDDEESSELAERETETETARQLDYELQSSENSACSSCLNGSARPTSAQSQRQQQWHFESDYETPKLQDGRRDNNAPANNNQGAPPARRPTRVKQHEQYRLMAQKLVSGGDDDDAHLGRQRGPPSRQRDPNASMASDDGHQHPGRPIHSRRQGPHPQNGSILAPMYADFGGRVGGGGGALERPYDERPRRDRPMLAASGRATDGRRAPLNNNPDVCALGDARRTQHQCTGNAQYASTRYVDQHRRLRHHYQGRHRVMADDLGGALRSQLSEAARGARRVFGDDDDDNEPADVWRRAQSPLAAGQRRDFVGHGQRAGGWGAMRAPSPLPRAAGVRSTLSAAPSDTEEASEQISIVIGTPTRRRRRRQQQQQPGGWPATPRVDSPQRFMSASAHATPTRSRRTGRHYSNRNHRQPLDYDYDYEDHYHDQLERGQRGHDWPAQAGQKFISPAGTSDSQEHSSPSPQWQQQQQQQQRQQSDNFLVASPPPMTGPTPQRRPSRRSTVSISSQEDYGEQRDGHGHGLAAAVLHNGRQFQRRPTGPFEARALSPAGGARHQQEQAGTGAGVAASTTAGADDIRPLASAKTANSLKATTGPAKGPSELSNANVAQSPAAPANNPQPIQKPPPPVKLKNLLTGEQTVDTMHFKSLANNTGSHGCNELRCQGAMINPKPVESRVRCAEETWTQAKEFIDGYYASIKRLETPAHKNRLMEIEEQIRTTETYYLRETELIYGAKLAWRNAPRCIGRIQWSKLQVFDARVTRNAQEMFEAICNHIKYATNKGSLRSAITIFPQRVKSIANDWRVWNPQLISYAGYRDPNGTGKCIAGDPANCDITEVCQRLGWQGPGGNFDVLPIVLSANGGAPQMFPLPEELVMRVKIGHPNLEWFRQLQLEWYALPAVSSMMLDVGGLQFTACPFNGWYMVTEVGARDLGDPNRYNMLEIIAQRMGLNTKTNTSLWRDQAVTHLNLAVLYSYQQAGVTMVDHHTASETFMTHLANEQRLRGGCPADWVWLVPPSASSTTQVFHQEMVLYHLLPNYEYLPPAYKNYDWIKWEALKTKQAESKKLSRLGGAPGGTTGATGATAAAAGDNPEGTPKSASSSSSPFVSSVVSRASTSSLSPFSRQRIGINAQQVAAVSANGSPSSCGAGELTPRHLRFKEIARAVKFTSKLFGKALSRRIKATILYATETGKSERFANKLAQIFSHAFNVHLMSMADYDMTCLEHEALLIIVTSTFGNGDPPENGEQFVKHLAAIKMTGDTTPDLDSIESIASNPFFQMLSENLRDGLPANGTLPPASGDSDLATSSPPVPPTSQEGESVSTDSGNDNSSAGSSLTNCVNGSSSSSSPPPPLLSEEGRASSISILKEVAACKQHHEQQQQHQGAPLSNVRFAVFALGSTAYPHFCAFGRYVDDTMGKLGAERIYRCACGDELNGQEKAFDEWAPQVFRAACDVFCVTDVPRAHDKRLETIWTPKDVRFEYQDQVGPAAVDRPSLASKRAIMANLSSITGKSVVALSVKRRRDLHEHLPEENLQTIQVDLESGLGLGLKFQPGDHISIYPVNKPEVVNRLLERVERDWARTNNDMDMGKQQKQMDFDRKVSILIRRDNTDPLTMTQDDEWVQCDTLPLTSVREALTRYLDITNPPNQDFLSILARQTSDPDDQRRLQQMASNFGAYEEWRNRHSPSLLSTLDEFKTVNFELALITQVPPMKPRFYSISGASTTSLTVSVVRFKTRATGEPREGLCSNYLNTVPVDPKSYVFGYVRSASAFHMVQDRKTPMLLICAGTGIAPFRAFWQQRHAELTKAGGKENFGPIDLYFGCRNSKYILYKDELDSGLESGALASVNIAISRPTEPGKHKMYVQDKLLEHKEPLVDSILHKGVHVYVCGDVAMADGVYKALAKMINEHYGRASAEGIEYGEGVLMNMRNNNRYHEDIFGSYYKQVA